MTRPLTLLGSELETLSLTMIPKSVITVPSPPTYNPYPITLIMRESIKYAASPEEAMNITAIFIVLALPMESDSVINEKETTVDRIIIIFLYYAREAPLSQMIFL
jgi:hypothetical protein